MEYTILGLEIMVALLQNLNKELLVIGGVVES